MSKKRDKQEAGNRGFKAFIVGCALAVTLLLVIGGAYVQEGLDVSVGQISDQRIKAPRRIENTVATERNRAAALEAAEKVEPVMERDTTVNEKVQANIRSFFDRVSLTRDEIALGGREGGTEEPTPEEETPEATTPENAASPEAEPDSSTPEPVTLPIHLNDSLTRLLLDMDDAAFESFASSVTGVTERIFEDGILDVEAKGLLMVKDEVETLDLKTDEKNLCYEIIAAYIEPNILVSAEATRTAKLERAEKYDAVYYLKDETIVDEGQRISEEAYAAMEALGLVKNDGGRSVYVFTGALMLVCAVFAMFCLHVRFFFGKIFKGRKEALLFFTLYLIAIFVAYVTTPLPYQLSANLVFVMLVAILFDARMSIFVNMYVTVICMLICKGDMEFVLYYLITGTFAAYVSHFTNERTKIIIAGSLTCMVSLMSYVGVTFFFEKAYTPEMGNGALYALIMGLLAVMISVGSAPFWEAAFGIVTPYRLIDLANPNNPILRRLTIEAPGTYHHSLIVANLAETAAYEIGANPTLARAGGYYHDIGKLKYPHYFAENQVAGANPHDTMDPYSSAQVLVSHVAYGLELAKETRVPNIIADIIRQHHGTTVIKYFYMRAKDMWKKAVEEAEAGGEEVPAEPDTDDFRYHYVVPQFKEAAIVMMADTVEAAVRAMVPSGKTMDEVEGLVRKLVKDKLDDGQLIDSDLTIKDIETVIQSFLLVFKGMYHDRIPYPESVKKTVEGGVGE